METTGRGILRVNTLTLLIFMQFGLSACGSVLPSTSKPFAPSSEAAAATIRIIVSFNNGGPANDPQLIERLKRDSGAHTVSYIGQLSPAIHIFSIQPGQGQSSSSLLQALEKIPTVSSAEIDTKATHH